ncbi:molybdopterin-dependent oxidoreductase [Acidovorax sp.]|uniref:molybdopterin-dependent oxidoreductase n=1 Tax=Acidovorax sp. TaxID=1872122 RepID=UPI00261E036F|nr:molybdopterin-dependent oxidoreductase [Acidovorax sp.]
MQACFSGERLGAGWGRGLVVSALALSVSFGVQALEKPTGPVLLTIEGTITKANQGQQAQFDMKMLERLPQHTFSTQTPWYPSVVTFTGPLLRDVLAAVGAKGTKITAVALNDYKTEIPADDATRHDVIVARLMNNRPMPIREKGPLFIVYPFDAKAELRSELYYNRAAWQLNALRIR